MLEENCKDLICLLFSTSKKVGSELAKEIIQQFSNFLFGDIQQIWREANRYVQLDL